MWHASQMEVRRPHSQSAAVVAPDDDEQMLMLHQYEELSTPLGAGLPPPQPGRRRSRWKEITVHCKWRGPYCFLVDGMRVQRAGMGRELAKAAK